MLDLAFGLTSTYALIVQYRSVLNPVTHTKVASRLSAQGGAKARWHDPHPSICHAKHGTNLR